MVNPILSFLLFIPLLSRGIFRPKLFYTHFIQRSSHFIRMVHHLFVYDLSLLLSFIVLCTVYEPIDCLPSPVSPHHIYSLPCHKGCRWVWGTGSALNETHMTQAQPNFFLQPHAVIEISLQSDGSLCYAVQNVQKSKPRTIREKRTYFTKIAALPLAWYRNLPYPYGRDVTSTGPPRSLTKRAFANTSEPPIRC